MIISSLQIVACYHSDYFVDGRLPPQDQELLRDRLAHHFYVILYSLVVKVQPRHAVLVFGLPKHRSTG